MTEVEKEMREREEREECLKTQTEAPELRVEEERTATDKSLVGGQS